MSDPIRLLLLEDSPTDAELIERELRKAGTVFVARRVEGEEGLVAALEEFRPDVVLADYALPRFDGLRALAICICLSHRPRRHESSSSPRRCQRRHRVRAQLFYRFAPFSRSWMVERLPPVVPPRGCGWGERGGPSHDCGDTPTPTGGMPALASRSLAGSTASTFATLRQRVGRAKNCVSRAIFLGLTFKLAEEAAKTWRSIRAPDKVAELLVGTRYQDGFPVPDDPPVKQREEA